MRIVGAGIGLIGLGAIGLLAACTPIEGYRSEGQPLRMVGPPGSKLELLEPPALLGADGGRAPQRPSPEAGALVAAVGQDADAAEAAPAQDLNATAEVVAGVETVIARHFKVNEDCSFAAPSIVVVESPRHGALRATQGPYTLTAEDGVAAACVGRTALAIAIHYAPESGYTGADRLTYRHDSVGEHAETRTIDVAIR